MESGLTYTINPEKRIVYLHYTKNLQLQDWKKVVESILADPQFQAGFNILSDRRAVTASETNFLRSAVDFVSHKKELSGIRWATVVGNRTSYGMARMAQVLVEFTGIEMAVFDKVEEAELWLLSK